MADDHNALLARADHAISVSRRGTDLYGDRRLIRDLAGELRALTSLYHTALDIIQFNRDRLSPFLTDEERAVLDHAKDPDHE